MLRFPGKVLALALLAACDETTAPMLASNVYRVVAVDNEALPTDVPIQRRAGCDDGVLQRSEFAFGADSMLEQRFWFTSDPSEQPALFRTSFVQHGSRISLSDGAGSGTFRGHILRLEMPPTQICASMTWEAVLKSRLLLTRVHLAVGLITLTAGGCADLSPGSRCGGNSYAHGRLTLPDTGISAGAVLVYSFQHRDPDLVPEQTDLSIQQTLEGFSPGGELPLVRLVELDGTVLLEQRATQDNLSLPWKVLHTSHDAMFRRELFEGLALQSVTLQLLGASGPEPGTLIRLEPEEQGVHPLLNCL